MLTNRILWPRDICDRKSVSVLATVQTITCHVGVCVLGAFVFVRIDWRHSLVGFLLLGAMIASCQTLSFP